MTTAGDCIHFNGIQHKTCEAGVNYDDAREKKDRGPVRLACLNASYPSKATCPKFCARTAEQAAKENAEIDAHIEAALAGKCAKCGETCDRIEGGGSVVLTCKTHGFVMRACNRIGDEP